jgi:hypothetical protein
VSAPRPFPLDDATRFARRDAPVDTSAAAATPKRTWPVLARVGEMRSEERGTSGEKTEAAVGTRRSYRVDSPHLTEVTGLEAKTLEPAKNPAAKARTASPTARPSRRYFHRLPGAIRVAIRTWLMLHPYRSLIRTAAMFIAMGITGASTVIMMSDSLPESPPDATSTAADQSIPEEATAGHGELGPMTEPVTPPEVSSAPIGPTAFGPREATRPEKVVLESRNEPAQVEKPESQADLVAVPVVVYPAPVYPTTSYPALVIETMETPTLPHVQTAGSSPAVPTSAAEPPASVARFEGILQPTSPR